jgi:NAD(P)-dependent dehydrogenase (short-subunit alcohol dehydrogenase family)
MADLGFDGKVAIITGAGGGLGRSHALELARRGALVVVNDLGGSVDGTGSGTTAAQAVVDEIAAVGGEAVANYESVATPEGGRAIVQTAIDTWGRIDIVVNNAGILRDASFKNMDADKVNAVLDVHLRGAFNVTQPAWEHMRGQSYGRIVNTSSGAGLFGNFGQTNYGAAKLGLVGFMNTLKIEGAKNNVHTNAVAPVAATRMTENLIPEGVQKALGPELVTPAVVYLCTEDAPNGVILQAQGGRFSVACVVENAGVDLGADATVEDIAEHYGQIADLTGAKPRNMLQLGG